MLYLILNTKARNYTISYVEIAYDLEVFKKIIKNKKIITMFIFM